MILTPKNWNSFQHYKDRSPAWIKLHKALLDDYEFACLPVASKALAPMLWLLASEYEDGKIDATLDKLAFRLHMTRGDLANALSPLVEKQFFDASEALADCKRNAIPEREEEGENIDKKRKSETRARDDWPDDFRIQFWERYPNKVGKPKALNKLESARRRGVIWSELMAGLDAYIRDKPPDRQWLNPETFINQERWNDQPAPTAAIAKPLTEFQRKQAETNDVTAQLRAYAHSGGSSGPPDRILPDDPGQQSANLRGGTGSTVLALPRAPDRRGA